MKRLENFSENTLFELSKWYRIFYNIYISSRELVAKSKGWF
nr:MAG TPA: hypothetical protein [Caudoviricetes sp.]